MGKTRRRRGFEVLESRWMLNSAPVLDPSGIARFTMIGKDAIDNSGDTAQSVLQSVFPLDMITDADGGALEGIAVTGADKSLGNWQFSVDTGAHWSNVGDVSESDALLLRPEDHLRFVPNVASADTATITFRAWDQTGSTAGQQGMKTAIGTPGGTSPFSTATETASIAVAAGSPVYIPRDIFGAPGSVVTVPVMIEDAGGLSGADITISYDTSLLDATNASISALKAADSVWPSGAGWTANVDDAAGTIVVSIFRFPALGAGGGSLMTIDFAIKDTAPLDAHTTIDLEAVSLNEGHIKYAPAPQQGDDPTDGEITVDDAVISTLVVSGFPSPITAGTAGSVTVTVKDQYGDTITGYTGTVHFTSSDSRAVLPSDYTFVAADNGVHAFSATLKTAGLQSITATDTVTATITGSQTGITVNTAAASTLVVSGFPSPITAGTAGSATVTMKDQYGNTATGYTGTVHFTSSDSQAILPGDYTFVAADNGVHAFSATLKTAGLQSITATDTVTAAITGSQTGILVNPAAVSTLVVAGFPSPITAGTAGNVTVTVKDPYGNIVTGYTGTVHFTSSDTQAVLPSDYTFVAADNGTRVFSVTLKTVGSQSITATATGSATVTGSQTGIVVNAANDGTDLVYGFVYADTNRNNKPDANEGVPGVKITLTNSGTTQTQTAWTDDNGWYEFRDLPAGTYQIAERQPAAFIDGGSNTFSVVVADGEDAKQDFRELGLRAAYVYNRLYVTSTHPVGSDNWCGVIRKIVADAEKKAGTPDPTPPVVTQQILQTGAELTVRGTNGNDSFAFIPGATQNTVILNGESHTFDAASVSRVTFDGGLGKDTAKVTGGTGKQQIDALAMSGTFHAPSYTVSVHGTEKITAMGGSGGDEAFLHDSAMDDALQAQGDTARLAAWFYSIELSNMLRVHAISSAGGHDTLTRVNPLDYVLETEGDWLSP